MSDFCNFLLKSFAYIAQIADVATKEKANEIIRYQPPSSTGGHILIRRIGDVNGRC